MGKTRARGPSSPPRRTTPARSSCWGARRNSRSRPTSRSSRRSRRASPGCPRAPVPPSGLAASVRPGRRRRPARTTQTPRRLGPRHDADVPGRLGRAEGVVLVLDDLQWANAASLLLLRYLVRFADEPLLVVATYNEGELTPLHPLRRDLRRRARAADRPVHAVRPRRGRRGRAPAGHDRGDAAGGRRPPPARADQREPALRRGGRPEPRRDAGGGRPQRRRDAVAHGRGIAIPDGVREAIDRRLRRLSPDCRRVLSAAAVLGPRWTFDLLVVVVGLDEEHTLDAVEEALHSRPRPRARGPRAPQLPFTNALVRDALYADLSRARTQMLHLRAADALKAGGERNPTCPRPRSRRTTAAREP